MMGELQKLIDNLLKTEDAVNWGWGKEAIELIEQKIDEMKKEFPLNKNILGVATKDHEKDEEVQMKSPTNDDYLRWIKEWFKKWLK